MPRQTTASGPIQVVVSLRKQKLSVYQSGRLIGTSRVSTGKAGSRTPTGIFSIIQKKRRHYSNIYYGAAMPYMQRLTWSGIALHQGVVPGYPASHGCIRLPGRFARELYRYTRRRNHVIVADADIRPHQVTHQALFRPAVLFEDTRQHISDISERRLRVALNDTGDKSSKSDVQPVLVAMSPSPPPSTLENSTEMGAVATGNVYHQVDYLDLMNERLIRRANKSGAPLRILITKRLIRGRIQETQRQLALIGYDPGPLDGVLGEGTSAAIKAFQRDQGLPPTGRPNDRFYSKLLNITGQAQGSNGVLRVRQNGKEVFWANVGLANPDRPLGTHLYTVVSMDNGAGTARWTGVTVSRRAASMSQVLDRIVIPPHVRLQVEDLLTPSSSMIVTDGGYERETGTDTDFIVLTKR